MMLGLAGLGAGRSLGGPLSQIPVQLVLMLVGLRQVGSGDVAASAASAAGVAAPSAGPSDGGMPLGLGSSPGCWVAGNPESGLSFPKSWGLSEARA